MLPATTDKKWTAQVSVKSRGWRVHPPPSAAHHPIVINLDHHVLKTTEKLSLADLSWPRATSQHSADHGLRGHMVPLTTRSVAKARILR